MQSIMIFGGDKRQIALSDFLSKKGYDVHITGFEKLGLPDEQMDLPNYVFLPVPYKDKEGYIKALYAKDKYRIADVVRKYPQSVYILGGCDEAAKKLFENCIRYIDLLQDEAFLIDNALLTAEAAICAYMKDSDTALCGAKCVVAGFGRISKFVCRLLRAYSAKVTAAARKDKDIALIHAAGMRAVYTKNLKHVLFDADVVFNTVPHHVFLEDELKSINKTAKVIELASPPYGMDIRLAGKLGVDVSIESGLPGRYFPSSAAGAILRAFEREESNNNGFK